jgi:hypothetical protein
MHGEDRPQIGTDGFHDYVPAIRILMKRFARLALGFSRKV